MNQQEKTHTVCKKRLKHETEHSDCCSCVPHEDCEMDSNSRCEQLRTIMKMYLVKKEVWAESVEDACKRESEGQIYCVEEEDKKENPIEGFSDKT